MSYEPKGVIVGVSERENVTRVVIEFDRMDPGPVAPAGLYIDPRTANEQFQLHRIVGSNGPVYTVEQFKLQRVGANNRLVYTAETFNSTHPSPKVGDVFSYRGWWSTEAYEAALDQKAKWSRQKYPDDGSHEHCLFYGGTIASYTENSEGYYNEEYYGWITCDSYEQFILGDVYHLRDKQEGIHAIQQRRWLEKRITEMEGQPSHPGRSAAIKRFRRILQSLED